RQKAASSLTLQQCQQKTKLAREFGISRETLYQYLRTDQ
ncbi:TPA: helix-turn-helix domain-containing protein, partial [Escherichia coli]|nr:helix-turn-helix domain-containing protein [Escherichia coli]HCO2475913.1 helix-turn-helix domain-containing protein [Escherichia coli]HDY2204039.1 helix-turn-helix domain-containing protein [Escherichia coli]